ncbi:MAG: hypothetical protein Tsb009_10480 [Planctomycetaceae bacterium]
MLLCIAICSSLGLGYFVLTPAVYEANAEVLIGSVTRDDRLLVSEPVMKDAVNRLVQTKELDFEGIPKDERSDYLRDRLVVRKPGGRPDILQLRYRAESPELASACLNAIVDSYVVYMGFQDKLTAENSNSQDSANASLLLNKLLNSKSQLEKEMARKRAQLFLHMRGVSQLGGSQETNSSPKQPRKPSLPVPRNSKEPSRFVPNDESPLKIQQTVLGKTPEEIHQLQVLAYENHLLSMLRMMIVDLSKEAEKSQKNDARVEVIQKATPPESPISPRPLPHVLIVTFVLGLTLGLGMVFMLEAVDDRCCSRAELSLLLDAPVFGEFSPSKTVSTSPSQNRESNSCQSLRIAIEASVDLKSCLVVTSSNSRKRHYLLAQQLAWAYSQRESKVLFISTGSPADDTHPLSGSSTHSGLAELLTSTESVEQEFHRAIFSSEPYGQGTLDCMSAGSSQDSLISLFDSQRMVDVLQYAVSHYDRVIIETAPTSESLEAALLGRLAGGVLLFVRQERESRLQLVRTREELQLYGCSVLGVVANGEKLPKGWNQDGLGIKSRLRNVTSLPEKMVESSHQTDATPGHSSMKLVGDQELEQPKREEGRDAA